MEEKQKNPGRVQAGKDAQRKRLERLGEDGYRDAQRTNAIASNRAQLAALGADGYREQRKSAFQALVAKIGLAAAKQRAKNGTEVRRLQRLANPTHSEQIAEIALIKLGFAVIRPETAIDALDIQAHPRAYPYIKTAMAIAECYIAWRWIGDFVLPFQSTVIEANGGCHRLTADRDSHRRTALEALGFRVVVLDDTDNKLTVDKAVWALRNGIYH